MERLTWVRDLDGMTDVGLRDGVTVSDAICRLTALERVLGDGYDPDHLRKLVQAEQDGRLVALGEKLLLAVLAGARVIENSGGGNDIVSINLEEIKTCDLVAELSKREGVETYIAEPYEDVMVSVNGPAMVLEVID